MYWVVTMDGTRIVVSFPARNEEEFLPQVLDALSDQTLLPIRVIIANDGSSDKTEAIAKSYKFVNVYNRDKREFTVVGKKEMANVWNDSITPAKNIHEEESIDFIAFLGGDIVLPPTYLQSMVDKFKANPKLMIAAGTMVGDHAYTSTGFMIPGPGRMMRYKYWLEVGGKYPYRDGWEAYPVYKAKLDGYETQIFTDIDYYPLRPTGGRTDYYAYGLAMKALGYFWLFALGRILKQPFMKARNVKSSWNMFRGYFFGKTEYYEEELREFVRRSQIERIRRLIPLL